MPSVLRSHFECGGNTQWECLWFIECECGFPSVGVVAPGECDSAVYCIYSPARSYRSGSFIPQCWLSNLITSKWKRHQIHLRAPTRDRAAGTICSRWSRGSQINPNLGFHLLLFARPCEICQKVIFKLLQAISQRQKLQIEWFYVCWNRIFYIYHIMYFF